MVDSLTRYIYSTDADCQVFLAEGTTSENSFPDIASKTQRTSLPKLIHTYRRDLRGRTRMIMSRALNFRRRLQYERIIRGLRPDLVYDVSGYYLRDMPGVKREYHMVEFFATARRYGAKVICLPKSFGPLTSRDLERVAIRLIENSDLIFCRDKLSLSEMHRLNCNSENIILSCDYTASVPAAKVSNYEHLSGGVAIIPNIKMTEGFRSVEDDGYINFLSKCASDAKSFGLKPFLLLHQPRIDLPLAKMVNSRLSDSIEVFSSKNHREIRGVISECRYVVSSRYHGIINALSSNVPAVCTGWSHKYFQLLTEHGLENLLVDDFKDTTNYEHLLAKFVGEENDRDMFMKIKRFKDIQHDREAQMWSFLSDLVFPT